LRIAEYIFRVLGLNRGRCSTSNLAHKSLIVGAPRAAASSPTAATIDGAAQFLGPLPRLRCVPGRDLTERRAPLTAVRSAPVIQDEADHTIRGDAGTEAGDEIIVVNLVATLRQRSARTNLSVRCAMSDVRTVSAGERVYDFRGCHGLSASVNEKH
jgi:hypothetical protein